MVVDLYPEERKMPSELVQALFLETQNGMTKRIAPSLTEAYFPSASDPDFMENGTAAFVDIDGTKLLVSNYHVIANSGLHHSFFGFNGFVNAEPQRYGLDQPFDVGTAKVLSNVWARHGSQASAIPFHSFAEIHESVPYEILWMAGYPGARIKQLSFGCYSVCQALPTQEYLFLDGEIPHESFDSKYHFAVAYSPAGAKPFDATGPSSSPGLSDPHGLSGSLIWNTNRIKCFHANQPWDPSFAVVTGILWGWPKGNYLIATKVEYIREFLLHASMLPSSSLSSKI